jgi:hypothetical protein
MHVTAGQPSMQGKLLTEMPQNVALSCLLYVTVQYTSVAMSILYQFSGESQAVMT